MRRIREGTDTRATKMNTAFELKVDAPNSLLPARPVSGRASMPFPPRRPRIWPLRVRLPRLRQRRSCLDKNVESGRTESESKMLRTVVKLVLSLRNFQKQCDARTHPLNFSFSGTTNCACLVTAKTATPTAGASAPAPQRRSAYSGAFTGPKMSSMRPKGVRSSRQRMEFSARARDPSVA